MRGRMRARLGLEHNVGMLEDVVTNITSTNNDVSLLTACIIKGWCPYLRCRQDYCTYILYPIYSSLPSIEK